MRKPVLLLAAVALGTAACSSTSSTQPPGRPSGAARPPPGDPAAGPYQPDVPPATPVRRRHLPGPGRQPVRAAPTATASPRSRSTSTPRRTRSPSATSTTATSPTRRPSASRSSSTPSTRTTRRPTDGDVRDQQRRRPEPVPRRGRGPAPDRRQGEGGRAPRAAGRGAHVRHRHLGLDGPRGPPRPRQAGAHLPRRPPPAARHRRDRRVRHRRAGRPRAHLGRRTPTAIVAAIDSLQPERLDQRRGRPAARLPAGVRRAARRAASTA